MFGIVQLDRKKQVSEQKARRQIEIIVPVNLRKFANDALDKCKDIRTYHTIEQKNTAQVIHNMLI